MASSIGASRVHRLLQQHTATALYAGADFDDLTTDEQGDASAEAEERYLAYVLLRQAGPQHHKLRMDLKNGYTTGDDKYPKTRQSMLHLLDQYSKTHVINNSSQGNSFAQRGGDEEYDREYWKDKKCYNCDRIGHPAYACTKPLRTKEPLKKERTATKGKSKTKTRDDDTRSVSSKTSSKSSSSKSSQESAFLLKTLQRDAKITQAKVKHTQALMAAQKKLEDVQETSDGSDISESGDDEEEDNTSLLQYGFLQHCSTNGGAYCFTSNGKQLRLDNTFLLDSQSTTTVICNKKFVSDIRPSTATLRLKSNGGLMKINQQATLKGFEGPVWYSPDAIANILALRDVKRKYKVTYDSDESMFVVHREHTGKPNMNFVEHESGLHFWSPDTAGVAFVETVAGNKQNYTKRQIKGAETARELYAAVGYPSRRDFRYAVQMKQIADCPITTEDVDIAHTIWGKSIAALKGKTTRKKPMPVVSNLIQIPRELLNLHSRVFLAVDIFFVNSVAFFMSISRKICYTATIHLKNRKHKSVLDALKQTLTFYAQRGLHIKFIHGDGEFESLRSQIEALPGHPRLEVAAPGAHVPEAERRIRVIEERSRDIEASLPFEQLPRLMVTHMVLHATKMLNYFPTSAGLDNGYSPRTLMTGEVLSFKTHLSLKFGDYCQVHEHDEPRNSQL